MNEKTNLCKRNGTAQKTKFSIKDFFIKCDQILNFELHFLGSVEFIKD